MPARAEPVHVEVALPSCGAPPPSPVSVAAALSAVLSDPLLSLPPPPPPPPPLNVRKMLSHAATLRGLDRAAAFRDVLEHAPAHERARRDLGAALGAVFESPDGVVRGNHSRDFLARAYARLERMSDSAPVFALRGLLDAAEVRAVREIQRRRRAQWSTTSPLVCFAYAYSILDDPALAGSWAHRSADKGCLNSSLSAAVAAAASTRAWSESLFVFRGEEALLDEVSARVEAAAGLRVASAKPWQLLRYADGADYRRHLDCALGEELDEAAGSARMATVLVSLNPDEFEGGETEFVELGLKLKLAAGSAILFHNFASGTGGCDPRMAHRSNPAVGGSKLLLQRWYVLADHPYLDFRKPREVGDVVLPEQAIVSCDATDDELSCRWYNYRLALGEKIGQ